MTDSDAPRGVDLSYNVYDLVDESEADAIVVPVLFPGQAPSGALPSPPSQSQKFRPRKRKQQETNENVSKLPSTSDKSQREQHATNAQTSVCETTRYPGQQDQHARKIRSENSESKRLSKKWRKLEKAPSRRVDQRTAVDHTSQQRIDTSWNHQGRSGWSRFPSKVQVPGHSKKDLPVMSEKRFVQHEPRRSRRYLSNNHPELSSFEPENLDYLFDPASLSEDQAQKQSELDKQSRKLEILEKGLNERLTKQLAFERDVEAHKKELDERSIKLEASERNCRTQKTELDIQSTKLLAFERDLMVRKKDIERKDLELENEIKRKRQQIAELKKKNEQEMEQLRNSVNGEIQIKQQIQRKLETLERKIEEKLNTLSQLVQNQAKAKLEFDVNSAKLRKREEACISQKNQIEALQQESEKKLHSQALKQKKKGQKLIELKKKVELEQLAHQKEVQAWAVSKAQHQEETEAYIRKWKSDYSKRCAEIEAKAAALSQQQKDFEIRAAVLRKRAKEIKSSTQRLTSNTHELPREPPDKGTSVIFPSAPMTCASVGPEQESATPVITSESQRIFKSKVHTNEGCDFVLLDSESEDECNTSEQPKMYRFDYKQNYNYNLSSESALEMQERLFREAAAKMKTQPSINITNGCIPQGYKITTPVLDIAERHPNHWKWKDPYAVLGLPKNAEVKLIKSQYRRLARTYHPDMTYASNTSAKFHAISAAYHKIIEHN